MEKETFEKASKLRDSINVLKEYAERLSRTEKEIDGEKVVETLKEITSIDLHFKGKTAYSGTITPETFNVLPIDNKARILLNTAIEVFWVNFIEILIAEINRLEEEFKSLKP